MGPMDTSPSATVPLETMETTAETKTRIDPSGHRPRESQSRHPFPQRLLADGRQQPAPNRPEQRLPSRH